MAWLPGVPAPSRLWAIGEEVSVLLLDTSTGAERRVIQGTVSRRFSPYSVCVAIGGDPKRITLAACGQIEGARGRHADYLADVAMGLRAPLPEWTEADSD